MMGRRKSVKVPTRVIIHNKDLVIEKSRTVIKKVTNLLGNS